MGKAYLQQKSPKLPEGKHGKNKGWRTVIALRRIYLYSVVIGSLAESVYGLVANP